MASLFDPTAVLLDLFRTVIQLSLMAVPVILLVFVVRLLLRNRLPAQWLYFMWLLVPIRLLLPWTPESSISVHNVINLASSHTFTMTTPASTDTPASSMKLPASAATSSLQQPQHNESSSHSSYNTDSSDDSMTPHEDISLFDKQAALNNHSFESSAAAEYRRNTHWIAVLSGIWLSGMAAAAYLMIRTNMQFVRGVRRHAVALNDPALQALLEDCQRALRIRRRVGLYVTDFVTSPALIGLLRPKVLLPADVMTELSERQLRHILLHELSHLKRRRSARQPMHVRYACDSLV